MPAIESKVNYRKQLTVEQSWFFWKRSWKRAFRAHRWGLIFHAITLVGVVAALIQQTLTDYWVAMVLLLVWCVYSLVKLPLGYVRGYFQLKKLCAELADELDASIGHDETELWVQSGNVRKASAWDQWIRYELVDDLLLIYFEDDAWPVMLSKEEVSSEYFWELIACMERRAAPVPATNLDTLPETQPDQHVDPPPGPDPEAVPSIDPD